MDADDSVIRRWFHVTPDRLIVLLLVAACVLWLSNWLGWPQWHKGYAVLTAVAAVGVAMFVFLLWFVVAMLFRRQFQFSILSLLILTVVVALPFSWLAVEVRKAKEQNAIVATVVRPPCWVNYDCQLSKRRSVLLVQDRLGLDFFADVIQAYFSNGPITDADVEQIARLDKLQILNLEDNHITDAALQHVKRLKGLQSLGLHRTDITDDGLKELAHLTSLKGLILDDTAVTDIGVEHLQGLTHLRYLWLCGVKMTDVGAKHLEALTRLEELRLSGTQITDAGVVHLKGLSRLAHLRLTGTQVTDSGLAELKQLSKLEWLYLDHTKITRRGAEELHQCLPNCNIFGDTWYLPPSKHN